MTTYWFSLALGGLVIALAGVCWQWIKAELRADTEAYTVELLHEDIADLRVQISCLERENMAWARKHAARLAPLKAANARRAADAQERKAA